jgi:hypothetical protein
LQTQSNISKRPASASVEPVSKEEVLESLKSKALEMFDQIDLDGNGIIDRCAHIHAEIALGPLQAASRLLAFVLPQSVCCAACLACCSASSADTC